MGFGSILIVAVSAFGTLQTANFQGTWKSTTARSEFTLSLKQLSSELTGSHCSVQLDGNRIDCGPDDSDVSITGAVNDPAVVTVSFKSFSGGSAGKATIKKLTSTTVEWTIIQKPRGEFYIPSHAVLTKLAPARHYGFRTFRSLILSSSAFFR